MTLSKVNYKLTTGVPQDGILYEPVDGFWWRYHENSNEWLKIEDDCVVDVGCMADKIRFDECGYFTTKKPRAPENMHLVEHAFK